jgi:hypothetical protein
MQIEQLLIRLKYGSTPWNAWRREHRDVPIVLDGACGGGSHRRAACAEPVTVEFSNREPAPMNAEL